jgi:hypothetical protein
MDELGHHLRFFIRKKMAEDPLWQGPRIVFSGAHVCVRVYVCVCVCVCVCAVSGCGYRRHGFRCVCACVPACVRVCAYMRMYKPCTSRDAVCQ